MYRFPVRACYAIVKKKRKMAITRYTLTTRVSLTLYRKFPASSGTRAIVSHVKEK